MSTQNKTPNTDTTNNINISFLKDGTLNYNFSPDLTLSEVIGSFVVIAHGLLSNNSNNTAMLQDIVSKLGGGPVVTGLDEKVNTVQDTSLFSAMDGLLSDFKANT